MNAVYLLGRSLIYPPTYKDCAPIPAQVSSSVRRLFRRPLILGASISANLKTIGPADRALRQIGLSNVRPRRLAANGQTGRALIENLDPSYIERASIVLAIDLFFWDATLPSVKRSLAALNRIVEAAELRQIPIVLATIPGVANPVFQLARPQLNKALRETARHSSVVRLLDLAKLHREIYQNGGFEMDGRFYNLEEVAPDGIHLSAHACEYLAQAIVGLF